MSIAEGADAPAQTTTSSSLTPARMLRESLVPFVVALIARLAVVIWGRDFPPTGDGTYYDTLARRLADGQGYTWLWPDGVVTYAAHYPVGYPALVALGYRIFGEYPVVAMVENAVLGALSASAIYVLARARNSDGETSANGAKGATIAALVVALHPALVPYTIALMTEGAAISLVCIAAALTQLGVIVVRGRKFQVAAAIVIGVATLVRPQCLLLAPVLGALSIPGGAWKARVRRAIVFTGAALLMCMPWTIRNCERMNRCALVSVNGGWNLLIGTQTENGAYLMQKVPDECKSIWDEAAKDVCFENAAKKAILNDPGHFIAKVPMKLGATLDYLGAAPWYLASSDKERFSYRAKVALGAVETVFVRVVLALACLGWGVRTQRGWRRAPGALGVAFALSRYGWVSYVILIALLGMQGRKLGARALLPGFTLAVIAETCIMHSIYFGGGRYGLITVPFVAALAFALPPRAADVRSQASAPNKRSPARSETIAREESPGSKECDAG